MKLDSVIDDYCAAWSEADAGLRVEQLKRVLVDDVTYTDPAADTRGIDALSDYISQVLSDRPGARVHRMSRVDAHHHAARFLWQLVMLDGSTLPVGLDIVTFDEQAGKLASILGFFGPLQSELT